MRRYTCPSCGSRAERELWAWWRELLFREKPRDGARELSRFQTVRCHSCGSAFVDPSIKLFGVFPARFFWVPHWTLFALIILFGIYLLGMEQ
jgi:DNA-directed RNA polymerase subunit RPC12/RpoP